MNPPRKNLPTQRFQFLVTKTAKTADRGDPAKLQLKQKLQDNYATFLKLQAPEKVELTLVNKLLANSFEFNFKAKAPIISRSADYRARIITSWKSEGRLYLLGASYTHNIRDISFFKLVPSKSGVGNKSQSPRDFQDWD